MASWELVRRRIRRPRISKRNGNQMVSRRTCTPVLPGKEVLSQRDLPPPSQGPPQLHRPQRPTLPRPPPLQLPPLTPLRLLLQPCCPSQQTSRVNLQWLAGVGTLAGFP